MTLPIVWRAAARRALTQIIRFIAAEDPAAARRMKMVIESAILPAADHPYMFRAGRVAGTREIVAHPNYIVVYRVTDTRLEVVSIVHARQHYP